MVRVCHGWCPTNPFFLPNLVFHSQKNQWTLTILLAYMWLSLVSHLSVFFYLRQWEKPLSLLSQFYLLLPCLCWFLCYSNLASGFISTSDEGNNKLFIFQQKFVPIAIINESLFGYNILVASLGKKKELIEKHKLSCIDSRWRRAKIGKPAANQPANTRKSGIAFFSQKAFRYKWTKNRKFRW